MKRTTRREFLRLAAATMGAGALGACVAPSAPPAAVAPQATAAPQGTTAPQATEAPPTETPAPTTTPASIAGFAGKKGILWGLQYDEHIAMYNRLNALFEKTTGMAMDIQPQGWPLEPKVIAAISAGTQPDAICIMPGQARTLIMQKGFMPTSDLVFKSAGVNPQEFWLKAILPLWMFGGEYYGVPVESSGAGWMVNVDVEEMKKVGIADKNPPTNSKGVWDSYDQLWEAAKAQMTKDGDKVTRWGLSSQGWEYYSFAGIIDNLLAARHVQWWDDANQKFYFDSDEGVKAMQLLVETPVKMGIETQMDRDSGQAAWAGQVAITRGNGGAADDRGWKLGYHYWEVAAPPAIAGQPPVYDDEAAWGFAGIAKAPNPDIAVAFLKMMCTLDAQREYAKIYGGMAQVGCVPLIAAADHFPNQDPAYPLRWTFQHVMKDVLVPNTLPVPYVYNESDLQGKLTPVFSDVRTGKITAQQAVKTMQSNAEGVWKNYQDQLKKTS